MNAQHLDVLAEADTLLHALLVGAQRLLDVDASAATIKLRKFAETLAADIARRNGLTISNFENFADLIGGLKRKVPAAQFEHFHTIRMAGNRAAHESGELSRAEALLTFDAALSLARWFSHEICGIKTIDPIVQAPEGDTANPSRNTGSLSRNTGNSVEAPAHYQLAHTVANRSRTRPFRQASTESQGNPDERLKSIANRALNILAEVGAPIESLRKAVASGAHAVNEAKAPFRLGIAGEFRVGKSTLINALLGADLALTGTVETTHTIACYRHGRTASATVHYVDGTSECLSVDEANTMLGARRNNPGWSASVRHLVFETPETDLLDMELWDAPGLGGSEANERIANQFIGAIGAAVWLFDAELLGDQSLLVPLGVLRAAGKRVLGVINRMDSLSSDDIPQAVDYVKDTYGDALDEVVAISALAIRSGDQLQRTALIRQIRSRLLSSHEADRQKRIDAALGIASRDLSNSLAESCYTCGDALGLIAHAAENLKTAGERLVAGIPERIAEIGASHTSGYAQNARNAIRELFARHGGEPTRQAVNQLFAQLDTATTTETQWRRLYEDLTTALDDQWAQYGHDVLNITRASCPRIYIGEAEPTPHLHDEVHNRARSEGELTALHWTGATGAALGILAAASTAVTWPIVLASIPLGLVLGHQRAQQVISSSVPTVQDAVSIFEASALRRHQNLAAAARENLLPHLALVVQQQTDALLTKVVGQVLGSVSLETMCRHTEALQDLCDEAWEIARANLGAHVAQQSALHQTATTIGAGVGCEGDLARLLATVHGYLNIISAEPDEPIGRLLVHLPSSVHVRWLSTAPTRDHAAAARQMRDIVAGRPVIIRLVSKADGTRHDLGDTLLCSTGAAWRCNGGAIARLGATPVELAPYPHGKIAAERRFGELWSGTTHGLHVSAV